jgi:hypothetical protein
MTATDTRPLPPVPTFPFSMFDPVHLGRDEYGQPVYVNLAERNMLLGGEPGAGKSSGLNLIVAHGALSCDCKLILVDGKQVELGMWRESADGFIGPSIDDAIEAFTDFQHIMNDRYQKLLATGRRKITRHDGEPVCLIPIDEYAYFSATVGTKQQRETFAGLSRDLVARGRAAGVIIVLATQRPSHQVIDPSMGTCSPTGGRSGAPPTHPPTSCSARAGPPMATPPPTSTPSHAGSAGCCPRPASPAGSRPPTSMTTPSSTWPPTRPACAARTPHDHARAPPDPCQYVLAGH